HNVHMQLIGGASNAQTEGLEPLGSYSNYFLGKTEKDWFTGIPHYARVRYKNVYPGIDVVYYVKGRDVEYDFEVAPGADPTQIELAFSEPPKLENGDVIVAGLRQRKPKVFQNGREIVASYRLTDSSWIQLALASYDREKSLTIDPTLDFSSYIGGPGEDGGYGIALDSNGFIYVAGYTQSPQSPVLNPFQQPNVVASAPFLVKLSPDGSRLVYYTVLAENAWDSAFNVAVDSSGNPVIIGITESANFPLKNPFQSSFKAAVWNGFVTKFTPDGRLLIFSTYLGGSNEDSPYGLTVDPQGNIYIAGTTGSNDFPVKSAWQGAYAGGTDCFLTKVTPAGEMIFSTYFGGIAKDFCWGVAVAQDGGAIVSGGSGSVDFPLKNAMNTQLTPRAPTYTTPVLFKFSPAGQSLSFSTFVGGPVAGGAQN
ncbi:MAG: SBBP repeat-containing protein, partial [Bryobacteraceae bacterium]